MAHRKQHIAILGIFGVGNFGNEASLDTYLQIASAANPNVTFVCICPAPHKVHDLLAVRCCNIDTICRGASARDRRLASRLRRRLPRRFQRWLEELGGWIEAYQQLRGASRLVVPGTGILDDYGTTPDGLPLQLLRWCAVARLRRIPVELLAVGAGPVEHPRSRTYMKWAAKLATKRSFRDTESREFVASLGINSRRDGVLPDLTFALPVLRREDAPPFQSRPLVALGVMAYFGWRGDPVAGAAVFENYVERMTDLAEGVLRNGMDVRLVTGESADERAVDAILARFAERKTSEAPGRLGFLKTSSFADVAQQVRHAAVLITSRYHNLVAAFTHGVPCISLSYSPKNDSLLRRVGVERYCLKIDTFRVDEVLGMLAEMMGLRQPISGRIAEQTLEWREELTRIVRQTEANLPVRGRDAGEDHS